ncbi:MAG: phosphotransferase family protein [Sphingomonadaceae bacterium]
MGRGELLQPESAEGRAALAAVLGRALALPVEVTEVVALSGGASSATWAITLAAAGESRRAIVQRSASTEHAGLSRATQAELLRRAAALGVPVAPVLAVPAPEDGLGDCVITGFVAGEALAPRWLRDPALAPARGKLVGQCAAALARLHAAPLAHWADLPLSGGSGAELLAQMFATYRRLGVDVPAFDLAFAWLKPRMPSHGPTCLAHGDFRSGNFLVSQEGLTAVLDWEIAHRSVPEEDLGWLCVQAWRFGNWQLPVGGFGMREELVESYRAAGGTVDAADLWTWEVFGNLRWGLSCLQLADDHVSGRVPSVERAAIGRRVSEVAADLVHAIERGDV